MVLKACPALSEIFKPPQQRFSILAAIRNTCGGGLLKPPPLRPHLTPIKSDSLRVGVLVFAPLYPRRS